MWDNIQDGHEHNFYTRHGLLKGPYDYRSIMHYGSYAWSKNGRPTIVDRNYNLLRDLGQRVGLSYGDIAAVRSMYGGYVAPPPPRPEPDPEPDPRPGPNPPPRRRPGPKPPPRRRPAPPPNPGGLAALRRLFDGLMGGVGRLANIPGIAGDLSRGAFGSLRSGAWNWIRNKAIGLITGPWIGGYPGDNAPKDRIAKWMAAHSGRVPGLLPVMTALAESGLKNVPYGDRDSLGYFQIRGMHGSAQQRMDPNWSLNWFVQNAQRHWGKYPHTPEGLGQWAQAVQRSAYPGRYATQYNEARRLVQLADGAVVPPRPGGTAALLAERGKPEVVWPLEKLAPMLEQAFRRALEDADFKELHAHYSQVQSELSLRDDLKLRQMIRGRG